MTGFTPHLHRPALSARARTSARSDEKVAEMACEFRKRDRGMDVLELVVLRLLLWRTLGAVFERFYDADDERGGCLWTCDVGESFGHEWT